MKLQLFWQIHSNLWAQMIYANQGKDETGQKNKRKEKSTKQGISASLHCFVSQKHQKGKRFFIYFLIELKLWGKKKGFLYYINEAIESKFLTYPCFLISKRSLKPKNIPFVLPPPRLLFEQEDDHTEKQHPVDGQETPLSSTKGVRIDGLNCTVEVKIRQKKCHLKTSNLFRVK